MKLKRNIEILNIESLNIENQRSYKLFTMLDYENQNNILQYNKTIHLPGPCKNYKVLTIFSWVENNAVFCFNTQLIN